MKNYNTQNLNTFPALYEALAHPTDYYYYFIYFSDSHTQRQEKADKDDSATHLERIDIDDVAAFDRVEDWNFLVGNLEQKATFITDNPTDLTISDGTNTYTLSNIEAGSYQIDLEHFHLNPGSLSITAQNETREKAGYTTVSTDYHFYYPDTMDINTKIGYMEYNNAHLATGFLIDENYALTNHHVVENRLPENLDFYSNKQGQDYDSASSVQNYWTFGEHYQNDWSGDIALVKLENTFDRYFELDFSTIDEQQDLYAQGYGAQGIDQGDGTFPWKTTLDPYYVEDGVVEYNSTYVDDPDEGGLGLTGGHSGSPVLNEENEVEAIHAFSDWFGTYSGGAVLTTQVQDWLQEIDSGII